LLSFDRLSKKPLLFKSFTGLTVQEFDDIHNKKIAKRYGKYEIQRFYQAKEKLLEKENQEQTTFQVDVKDRFLILLVYYRVFT
jgi:hypothetical protein